MHGSSKSKKTLCAIMLTSRRQIFCETAKTVNCEISYQLSFNRMIVMCKWLHLVHLFLPCVCKDVYISKTCDSLICPKLSQNYSCLYKFISTSFYSKVGVQIKYTSCLYLLIYIILNVDLNNFLIKKSVHNSKVWYH